MPIDQKKLVKWKRLVLEVAGPPPTPNDPAIYQLARDAVPGLIAEVERLQGEFTQARETIDYREQEIQKHVSAANAEFLRAEALDQEAGVLAERGLARAKELDEAHFELSLARTTIQMAQQHAKQMTRLAMVLLRRLGGSVEISPEEAEAVEMAELMQEILRPTEQQIDPSVTVRISLKL